MTDPSANANRSTDLYPMYELLDRYEELIEDMRELGVTSLEQAEAKIAELNDRIDEVESGGRNPAS